MVPARRILLIDRSGKSNLDLLILLKVSGYEVEFFADVLAAVNRYRSLLDTELAFALVIAIDDQHEAPQEDAMLVEYFERLILMTKKNSQLHLFGFGVGRSSACYTGELLDIMANEFDCAEKPVDKCKSRGVGMTNPTN